MTRNGKRTIIIAIYCVLFLFFIGMIKSALSPNPTCVDGEQNQKEEGIDCGGPCAPCKEELVGKDLVVTEAHVVYGGENKYDVVAELHNPNALYGGEKVYYTVELVSASGDVLNARNGETFILPNENKYIMEIGMETNQRPSTARVSIDNVKWVQFTEFDAPQIIVKNQRFGLLENDVNYAEAIGLVVNESPYDFHNIVTYVILKDERGVPIAINKTETKTLDADSQREFRLTWPHNFPGTISSSEMQSEVNIFDALNFMKKYFPDGRYGEFIEE
jgi:hypothetical protein